MNIIQIARRRYLQGVPAIDSMPSPHHPPSRGAAQEGYRLANLMRLREEAAAEVDRLLAFLDATEGDIDLDLACEDEGADFDLEPDVDDEWSLAGIRADDLNRFDALSVQEGEICAVSA